MKIKNLVSFIFIFIGTLFLLIGIFVPKSMNKKVENAIETRGTIIEIYDEDVYVSFESRTGEEYKIKSNYYSSDMRIGDKVKVYYNELNPNDAKVDIANISMLLQIIFLSIGGLLIVISIILLISSIRGSGTKKKLLTSGLMLNATISSVDCNTYIDINGRHPYIIRANFIYNGLTYETKSENMWNDPQFILNNYNIRELPVYIDSTNPKTNYLDISEIKNKLGK